MIMSGYRQLFTVVGIFIVAAVLGGCEGAKGTQQGTKVGGGPVFGGNTAPTAVVGPATTLTAGVPATLDGTGSFDPQGNPLTYNWTLTGPTGSGAGFLDATTSTPKFTPDLEGNYYVSLIVNDGILDSFADEVIYSTTWFFNDTAETAAILTNTDFSPVLVNVQSLDPWEVSGVVYTIMSATGIPNYVHTVTAADYAFLKAREASYPGDFAWMGGYTVGDVLDFGANIGLDTTGPDCGNTGGIGWWPPGPNCPQDQTVQAYFPNIPAQEPVDTCYTKLDTIGLLNNGVAVFNWSDGLGYLGGNDWNNLAAKFEVYDLDLCLGHAELNGKYHQHLNVPCLEEQMGETGTAHSLIYGYAADGYPLYGPWEANGVKAQSCWMARDYADQNPGTTGCDNVTYPHDPAAVPPTFRTAGDRVCQLKDPYDWTAGTTAAATEGPLITDVVPTQSLHNITAVSGVYFEDYYYDAACTGGEFLDEHNGHDTGDGRGYHYHLTDTFPYNIGPSFYGTLHPNGLVPVCSTTP